jgi:hypothetical protein
VEERSALDLFGEDDISRMDVGLSEGAATVHELNAPSA